MSRTYRKTDLIEDDFDEDEEIGWEELLDYLRNSDLKALYPGSPA